MDQSVNIPWAAGMNYGMGVNLLTGDIAGKAVEPGEITAPTKADGQTVSYDLIQINSMEELYSSLDMSIEASGRYGLFNASAKAKYANQSKFNSQATFLLARCVVMNAFTQVEDAQIREEAANILSEDQTFHNRYGDGYVRGMQTGGEFFVTISITSSTKEEQQSIAANLKATYGTKFGPRGEGEAGLNQETQSKIARSELRVSTYQRGGKGADQSLVETVEAAMERLRVFPEKVAENPVPYEVQVANYQTLALPEGQNPIDIENQKDALEEYARQQLKYVSLRNDIEFMQLHPEYFEPSIEIKALNDWNEFFTTKINELKKQASNCAGNYEKCNLIAFSFPDDFDMFYEAKRRKTQDNFSSAREYYKEVVKRIVINSYSRMHPLYTNSRIPFMYLLKSDLLEKPDAFESHTTFEEYVKSEGGASELEKFEADLESWSSERDRVYGIPT